MTHFVGLVMAETQGELDDLLQPYHEYECTGIRDKYVVKVDVTEEAIKDFEKYKTPRQCFSDFCKENGWVLYAKKVTRLTNPNKKWDWWVVGGRWRDTVPNDNCKTDEIEKYFPQYIPGVFIDNEGWHEAEEYGWFEASQETTTPDIVKEKLAQNPGKTVWIVDFHI